MKAQSPLLPCSCGSDRLLVSSTTDYVEVFCTNCGASNRTLGKKPRYTSAARCFNAVWPLAVKEWNKASWRKGE